jgi:hypothetical protein
MALDRQARDRLARLIEDFLGERIGAFEFDERIGEVASGTSDPTVRHIGSVLWSFYDDCKDHKAALSRSDWNFIQRLLLVLRSDCAMEMHWSYRRSVTQAIAIAALVILCLLANVWDVGLALLVLAIPLALTSIGISALRRSSDQPTVQDIALSPFGSLAEIASVRRRLPTFAKSCYPDHLGTRQVRSAGVRGLLTLQWYILWIAFAPFVLALQSFPVRRPQLKVQA